MLFPSSTTASLLISTLVATLASSNSLVSALPKPEPAPAPAPVPAIINAINPGPIFSVQDDTKSAYCSISNRQLSYKVGIDMDGWGRDYGQGLLDNLRGQCGAVTEWEWWSNSNTAATAWFNLPIFIRSHCVEDAIWLASGGVSVNCERVV
jgi:hypothetical protein